MSHCPISNVYLSVFDEAVLLEVLLALFLLLRHEVGRVGRVALLAVAASVKQEGNGPIDFGRQGPWKIKVQILVASTSLVVTSDLKIELSDLNYLGIHVHITSNGHFGGLRGHGGLKTSSMASEFKFDLGFEISNLNYRGIIVHVASNSHFGGL